MQSLSAFLVVIIVMLQDFQASIVSENFHTADPACTKSEEFIDIQDGRGIIVTHQVELRGKLVNMCDQLAVNQPTLI